MSMKLTPAAATSTSSWPGPGCGSGTSAASSTSGPPVRRTTIARMPTSCLAQVADDEQADAYHGDRDQHAEDRHGHVVMDDLPGDREPEHGDEMHDPDPGGPDRHRGQHQPARPGRACVGPGPGGAPEPEEGAQDGHRVGECRGEQAVREVVNRKHATISPFSGRTGA